VPAHFRFSETFEHPPSPSMTLNPGPGSRNATHGGFPYMYAPMIVPRASSRGRGSTGSGTAGAGSTASAPAARPRTLRSEAGGHELRASHSRPCTKV
jgi:hypothetical protein